MITHASQIAHTIFMFAVLRLNTALNANIEPDSIAHYCKMISKYVCLYLYTCMYMMFAQSRLISDIKF